VSSMPKRMRVQNRISPSQVPLPTQPEPKPTLHNRGILNNTELTCINKDQGCTNTCTYESLSKHENTCKFKPISCPNSKRGCAFTGMKKDVEWHITEKCEYALHSCQCGMSLELRKLSFHLDSECLRRIVQCKRSGCAEYFEYRYANRHEKECLYCTLQCKWCEEQMLRRDIQTHQENCAKAQVLCQKCRRMVYKNLLKQHVCQTSFIENNCFCLLLYVVLLYVVFYFLISYLF
jgi:hypothetical protein